MAESPDRPESERGLPPVSLGSYELKAETAAHWKLPGRLREISGLAMTGDGRLLAHNDERGVVFEIDYRDGSIVKAFQLADTANPVAGDFEGIAATGEQIYLTTSSGRLYECREGADQESVLFTVIPVIEFSRPIAETKFQPSGIERHPASGNYFVVAARQRAIAEITPGGKVLAVRQFPARWHRQIEGITFAADNTLIVADEGAGKKAGVTLYPVSGGVR